MELTGTLHDVVARLMPDEEPATGVAVVTEADVAELHVTVGPVTFRLLDRAALDALGEAVELARIAAGATWSTCEVCTATDAMVGHYGPLVAHLSCSYDADATRRPVLSLVR